MKAANQKQRVPQDIIKQIRNEISDITNKENLPDNGKGFAIWILSKYFDKRKEDAVRLLLDSPNDKKVDALLDEDDSIKIIQCKLFEDIKKEVGDTEIASFKGCVDWLKNPKEVEKLNLPRFHDAALSFVEGWNENKNVELHFFVFGLFSSGAKHECIVFNNSDLRDRVQMYFHDIKDIELLYKGALQERNPLASEKFKLDLTPGEYFEKKEKFHSLVATIKGKDILNMYEKYGNSLFERNIRFYRGTRKGSINAQIVDTAVDKNEQDKFWYFNNGISFICSNFVINKKNKSQPVLEVEGFQIINGCQTTVCLSEARGKIKDSEQISDKVQIVVRFIKAPVEEVDLITLYTNSQNPVSEIQLKSNCPIQKRLQDNFSKCSPQYFYSIKEGDWQKLSASEKRNLKDRVISMVDAAQALYSFKVDPVFARRYTIRLFSEKYHEVFRKDLKVEEILFPWRALKAIEDIVKKYRVEEANKLKKSPASFTDKEKEEVLKKEFLLYSNLILLNFVGKLVIKKYKQYTATIASKLLNKQLEKRVTKLVEYIVSALKVSAKLKGETNLPRYLKNLENVNSLYEEVERVIESDAARLSKDPLRDMLPNLEGR